MALPPLVEPADSLSASELARVDRQLRLPELGELGQRRLSAARVVVVGAGGLGAPALLSLASAGVGTIGIVDDDVVELHNLHRQPVHGIADVGRPKVDSAAETVLSIAPDTVVRRHPVRLDASDAAAIFAEYDLVVDGTDTFETRYLIGDVCAALGIPLVWASVLRFDAQLSVFWSRPTAGEPVVLRDLFPEAPAPGEVPSCSEAGVIGALCGQVGSMMANEAVKLIAGIGEPLLGRVLVIDALTARQREIPLRRAAIPDASGNADAAAPAEAAAPAGAAPADAPRPPQASERVERIERIDSGTLATMLAERGGAAPRVTLLDVREPREHEAGAIAGSILLPLGEVLRDPLAARTLLPDGEVVVHCHFESRAERAAAALARVGVEVRVLDGGFSGWASSGRPVDVPGEPPERSGPEASAPVSPAHSGARA